jgi:predicted regulator of Ras-like GTPase activity (Roadblock/LC7/MglB family)
MKAKKPERVAAVALANKLARICWAILSTGERFREELYTQGCSTLYIESSVQHVLMI